MTRIYPVFLPLAGCPQYCIFCNQEILSGGALSTSLAQITETLPGSIDTYLGENPDHTPLEIAFYGGSFTGLPETDQVRLLNLAGRYRRNNLVDGIRISTRPDLCSRKNFDLLHEYGVTTIELGIESLSDDVLTESGRGYTLEDVCAVSELLNEYPFTVGFQFMIGLPGEKDMSLNFTILKTRELKPAFVRIHPTLVLKDTPLETLFRKGAYTPLTMQEATSKSARFLLAMEQARITVARLGLHPNPRLVEPGAVVAGPFHPSFRQLVENEICFRMMLTMIQKIPEPVPCKCEFLVPQPELSNYIGQNKSNLHRLVSELPDYSVTITADDTIPPGTAMLRTSIHTISLNREELVVLLPDMRFLVSEI